MSECKNCGSVDGEPVRGQAILSASDVRNLNDELAAHRTASVQPVPMLLWCPLCHERHIDVGEFATKPHHTHACQTCGNVWRPAIVPTTGVQFLPGFKNN